MNEQHYKAEEGFAERVMRIQGRESRITLATPGSQLALYHDTERCIGCFGCEVHCKLEHDVPVGPRLIRVMQVGPNKMGGRLKTVYVVMTCFHCNPAPCVEVCPTGAMQKREDGIVFVDENICIGCKTCVGVCPFGAVQLNPKTKKVIKCDYCKDRVDHGLWPACATKCTTKALYFGTMNEWTTIVRQRYAREFAYKKPSVFAPAPVE